MGGRTRSVEQIPLTLPANRRIWYFRLGALGLVVVPLLLCEMALALFDPSWARMENDPLVGFSETKPLFELNPSTDSYQIRKDRLRAFVQNGFPSSKQANTFRIFCLGGSTVQGRPYSIDTAFTTWLRLTLESACPDRSFEVINCGGVSYASYRLNPILKECLQYEPDLILICTGNNEFLEDRSYAFTKKSLPILDPTIQILSHSRVIRSAIALGTKWTSQKPTKAKLGPKVAAMLDYERGIERYHRNDAWRQSVEEHFRVNVQQMIQACQHADVPVMILSPCVNLKDTPPFKSQHDSNLSSTKLELWEQHIASASTHIQASNLPSAFEHMQKALQLDPKHAMTWYSAGQLLYQSGKFQQAKRYFEKALEEDVCPLRIRSGMRATLAILAQEENIPIYDLQEKARLSAPTLISGSEFLVDHVHPSINAHQTIGKELAMLIQTNWLKDPSFVDPTDILLSRFQDHLNSLPDHYFANGLQRLQNLRAWTHGRADGPPIESLSKPTHGL